MKQYAVCSFAVLLGLGLVGCGGGGGKNSPGVAEEASAEVEGTAAKGIMANAIIQAYQLDSGKLLGETRTNDDGVYSLKLKYEGAVKLVATTDDQTILTCDAVSASGCGTFGTASEFDLNKNSTIDFGERYYPGAGHFELVSHLPHVKRKEKISSSITPITHVVWQLQEQSGDLSAANHQAIFNQVNNLFGIEGDALARPIDITAPVEGSIDQTALAHSAIVAALATWAYQQPEGFQQGIERLASILSSNNLIGTSDDPAQPGLSNLMKAAMVALEQVAANNPGVAVGDIIAAFAIREHIGNSLGGNFVTLPKPGVDYTEPFKDRLNKGKSLVADLRTWANAVVDEAALRKAQHSERVEDMQEVANAVRRQQPLLEDAYRLFANPANTMFSAVWNDIYSCLSAGAKALEAGAVVVQPAECPAIQLSADSVTLNGPMTNGSGVVVGNLNNLTLQTQPAADPSYSLSGNISNEVAGVTLKLNSAVWTYRLKYWHSELPSRWSEASQSVDYSSLTADIELSDHQPVETRTAFAGTWSLTLQHIQENDWAAYPQVLASVDGTLTSPNGTLEGALNAELTKLDYSYYASLGNFSNTRNNVEFSGKMTNAEGEILEGNLSLGTQISYLSRYKSEGWYSQHESKGLSGEYLDVAIQANITSRSGLAFNGGIHLKLLQPSYNYSKSEYFWWQEISQRQSGRVAIDLLDVEGEISTVEESYRLRTYVDVHNPERWIIAGNQAEYSSSWYSYENDWEFYRAWYGSLEETEDDFVHFSATLLFEETLPGRESTWVSLSVDRTGYKQGNAQLRLTSTQGDDWRSLTAQYNSAMLNEPGLNYVQFTNQNGASLWIDFQCEQPGQTLFETCDVELTDVKGKLQVNGEDVGQMKVLDNRLIKVTYIDGQFETLQ